MSAYGAIKAPVPGPILRPRTYVLPSGKAMTIFHCRRDTIPDDLLSYIQTVFNGFLEEGRTYPQLEQMDKDAFSGYFVAGDVFVGLADTSAVAEDEADKEEGLERQDNISLESVRNDRSWKESVLGFYYVKPNYPGRSSHICNAGFCVPKEYQGIKASLSLGKSYLKFAPRLGYKASVFNLVYTTNKASMAIWDRLGFTRAGLIPKAGRLKTEDGSSEEYVDAVVYYYEFK